MNLGGYFAPSYFGSTIPDYQDRSGFKPEIPPETAHGDTGILRWVYARIQSTGWFETVALGRNPGPPRPDRNPLCWIYPVGFNERNDALDLAIRQTSIVVMIAVDCDRDGDTLAGYEELERLAKFVCERVEAGPAWVDPSPGGLLSGRYDPPTAHGQEYVPLDKIYLALTFAYSWNRDK